MRLFSMPVRLPLILFALTAASATIAAPAKKAKTGAGDVTRAQMIAEVDQVFNRADTDHDGFMSLAEFRVRMGAVLNRTPPGSTGAPTQEEAQRLLNAALAAFKAVDEDGNGKLSRAESRQRPLAAFDMMDTDHNGIVTVAEKRAAQTPAAKGTARKK